MARQLVFEQGSYEFIDGRFFFLSHEPDKCPLCTRTDSHKHGSYPRKFTTFRKGKVVATILHNRRWLCCFCRHTQSITPPHLLRRIKACSLVVFALLWIYVNSARGFENCEFGALEMVANRRTFFRYLTRAKKNALFTLQILREVAIENVVPGAWESLTLGGLSPPDTAKMKVKENALLWEALCIAVQGASHSDESLFKLLARAHERSNQYERPFLIEIQ